MQSELESLAVLGRATSFKHLLKDIFFTKCVHPLLPTLQ